MKHKDHQVTEFQFRKNYLQFGNSYFIKLVWNNLSFLWKCFHPLLFDSVLLVREYHHREQMCVDKGFFFFTLSLPPSAICPSFLQNLNNCCVIVSFVLALLVVATHCSKTYNPFYLKKKPQKHLNWWLHNKAFSVRT